MNKEELLKKYDKVGDFYDGFAEVRLNGKCGFINEKFQESKIIYDYVGDFYNGFARVRLNDKWGFISKKFKESKIIYNKVFDFKNGFAVVKLNGERRFIDEKYKVASQEEVLSALCYREDDEFYYFKKILHQDLTSPYQFFQYELNKEYEFCVNENVMADCGGGFNVATEEWIK